MLDKQQGGDNIPVGIGEAAATIPAAVGDDGGNDGGRSTNLSLVIPCDDDEEEGDVEVLGVVR